MINEIVGTAARYQQLLSRKFGLIGGAPSPQLTPEISPSMEVSEIAPESRILASEFLCSGYINVSGVAAKFPVASIFNPLGSNIIAVIERIVIINGNAAAAGGSIGMVAAVKLPLNPAAGAVIIRDGRSTTYPGLGGYTRLPTCTISGDNNPGTIAASNLDYSVVPALTGRMEYGEPVVLAAGWRIDCVIQANLYALQAIFTWREIPLAAGEVGPF